MCFLRSRALFAARQEQHQSYGDQNCNRSTKYQMRQWWHSRLLAEIRHTAPAVGQLYDAGSTKVRHAPSLEGAVQRFVEGSVLKRQRAMDTSAGKRTVTSIPKFSRKRLTGRYSDVSKTPFAPGVLAADSVGIDAE
jgi:hypothetical protein